MSRSRGPNYAKSPSVSAERARKLKYRYLEFKYLYFQVQKLLHKKVVLSLKYDQLKTPEIRTALIKPLVLRLIEISKVSSLNCLFNAQAASDPTHGFETPQISPLHYGSVNQGLQSGFQSSSNTPEELSSSLVYVLLLLRYEFIIQMESNFVMYDLLSTKANVCELLAIRMLREYRSLSRMNLLFVNPMGLRHGNDDNHILKDTKHLDTFNTLELSILTKSKKFLSQPVVVHILEKIYNGEVLIMDQANGYDSSWLDILGGVSSAPTRDHELSPSLDVSDAEKSIVDYGFNKVTMKKVIIRSHVVPKYQSIVINLKYAFLTFLFFVLVLRHKQHLTVETGETWSSKLFSLVFWTVALSFNFDNIQKLLHIEFKFLKKIVWTYVDLLIIALIDISFILRLLFGLDKIDASLYYGFFSLIPIFLFPRMLSVFNNYQFFNMMILSFKKMSLYMIAMFSLFVSLIFGFFLCFISLTIDLTVYEVAFSMLKLFFGFTPAVWDNWKRYNNLGRVVQLAYLFLVQFIVATILAIVLSNVFTDVTHRNKEEFEYMRTTNLIIYLKWGKLSYSKNHQKSRLLVAFNGVVSLFKMPIICTIYLYEILIKDNKRILQKQQQDLKHFTFLNKEQDFYEDNDMVAAAQMNDDDSDVSTLMMNSRRNSHFAASSSKGAGRSVSHASNVIFFGAHDSETGRVASETPIPRNVISKFSVNTLGGLRHASEDSTFLEDFLGKRYGRSVSTSRRRVLSGERRNKKKRQKNELAAVMAKLSELESLIYSRQRDVSQPKSGDWMYDLTEASDTDIIEVEESESESDHDSENSFGTV